MAITHVMVGQRGLAALPPQLRPQGSQPAPSAAKVDGKASPLPQSGNVGSTSGSMGAAAAAAPSPAEAAGTSKGLAGQGSGQQQASGAASVGSKRQGGPPQRSEAQRGQRLLYVSHTWLEQSLAKHCVQPEADHPPPDPGSQPGMSAPAASGKELCCCCLGREVPDSRWPRAAGAEVPELLLALAFHAPHCSPQGHWHTLLC